ACHRFLTSHGRRACLHIEPCPVPEKALPGAGSWPSAWKEKVFSQCRRRYCCERDLGSSRISTRPPQASSLASPVSIRTVSLQPLKTFGPSESTTCLPVRTQVWEAMSNSPFSAVGCCVPQLSRTRSDRKILSISVLPDVIDVPSPW